MPSDLRTYLSDRLTEVEEEAAQLQARLAFLNGEMENIKRAAAATGIALINKDQTKNLENEIITGLSSKKTTNYTMKDAAVRLLRDAAVGLTANEIRDRMRDELGLNYPRSSLSPQLSRLKKEGVLCQNEGRWMLLPTTSTKAGSAEVK